MSIVVRLLGILLLLVALGAAGAYGRVAAQDHPAGAWFTDDEAEATPVEEQGGESWLADSSSPIVAPDDQSVAEDDDVQAAQLSYAPVGDPISICVPQDPNNPQISVGNSVWWSGFAYINTGDEPLIFDYEVTDTQGNSTTSSAGEWGPSEGPAVQVFTTATALDTLNWEIERTVTITVTGADSGEEATESYSLVCPIQPFASPVAFLVGCSDDPGPYQAGDVYRFPVQIDNTFSRSSTAIDTFSLTTDDGSFDPTPPTSLGQDELVELELLHELTAEEIGQSIGASVSATFTYGPPAGSAAEGVYGPFTLTRDADLDSSACLVQGNVEATATPVPTETPVPTAEPTSPGEPTATNEPSPTEPAPTAVGAATETPAGSVSALPDTGSGTAGDPASQFVVLVVLLLGCAALAARLRLLRRSNTSSRR